MPYFPDNEDTLTVYSEDYDRNARVLNVFLEPFGDVRRKLHGCHSSRLQVSQQNQRDSAIGPDGNCT